MGRNKNNNNNGPEAARMASWAGSQFSLMSPTPVEPNHNNKKLFGFGGSSTKVLTMMESGLETIEHDDLKQGSLYIVKIRNVSVALFEGWDDDMCCFAVLRSDSTPMRWSEARYIPGDFDAYDAFDEAGNPPVHLWTRHLRVNVPINWFSIFEEARRKQRNWMNEQNEEEYHYYPVEEDQVPANNKRRNKKKQDEAAAAAMNTPPETDKSSSRSGSGDEDAGDENASEDEQEHHTENEDEDDQEDAASTTSDTPKVTTPAESPKAPKSNATTTTTAPIKNNRGHSHTSKKEQPAVAAATPTPQSYQQQQQQQAVAQPQPPQQVINKPINKSEIPVASSPKYLNTPPASPINALPSNATAAAIQATRQQQQQSFEKNNNLFGSTDFAFPHNETQFSIQSSGFSDSVLSTSSSLGGINTAAHQQQQQQQQRAPVDDTAPAKSKRRSVQGLFRK